MLVVNVRRPFPWSLTARLLHVHLLRNGQVNWWTVFDDHPMVLCEPLPLLIRARSQRTFLDAQFRQRQTPGYQPSPSQSSAALKLLKYVVLEDFVVKLQRFPASMAVQWTAINLRATILQLRVREVDLRASIDHSQTHAGHQRPQ